MSRKLALPIIVLLALLVAIYTMRSSLVLLVMERGASRMMDADTRHDLPPGLSVGVCGAGGPLPDPKRSGPCLVVMAGDTLLMVDAGTNGARNLNRMRLPIGDLDAVLLTHFHSDHIDGLGEAGTLRWASQANTSPLPVVGPTGVERVVTGFNLAYDQDTDYRHAHHGDTVAPLSGKGLVAQPFAVPAEGEARIVWDKDGLKVTAFSVDHDPVKPSVGYRFDYAGRSLVISGDTAQSSNLEAFAKGADLLLHEALNREMVGTMQAAAEKNGNKVVAKITFDIQDYHTSPEEAAASAKVAGVGHLAFYHIVPVLILPGMEATFLDGVEDVYNGPVTLTRDGTLFSLPKGSKDVKVVKKGL